MQAIEKCLVAYRLPAAAAAEAAAGTDAKARWCWCAAGRRDETTDAADLSCEREKSSLTSRHSPRNQIDDMAQPGCFHAPVLKVRSYEYARLNVHWF